jgi:hypothetical protein
MKAIKKAGIITGAVLGGIVGGTVSVIGKVSKKKFVDELGESIIDSSILTGELYGGLASGATEVISGKIKKDQKKVDEGIEDIKESGGAIVGNIIINTKNVIDNSGEVVSGIKHKDGRKILRGVKSLAKYAAVSTITVGSMKIKQSDKYFSSASTTPAATFPTLLSLAQHHISKLDYGVYYDKMIGEIMDKLEIENDPFPKNLSLDDQGIFYLGFYHQRNNLYKGKDTQD